MFHFLPGSNILSIATAGCNLHCKFCQNWQISQSDPEDLRTHDLPPDLVVALARARGCASIAYTYSEPIVFYEYTYDTCKLAHEDGLRNILVTAGFINEKPLMALMDYFDGANVDLKSFDKRFYKEMCGGALKPVLRTLELMAQSEKILEITNLVVPSHNDDLDMISRMCDWIVEHCGPDTPLHFSRFFPKHQMRGLPPTPSHTLRDAAGIAQNAGLNHVYVGNIRMRQFEVTYCPSCHNKLIERQGYRILSNQMAGSRCGICQHEIHGIWR